MDKNRTHHRSGLDSINDDLLLNSRGVSSHKDLQLRDSCSQPYDIGMIAEVVRHLNREDKFKALNNVYKPPSDYVNTRKSSKVLPTKVVD